MARFQLLTADELRELESEFVEFLVLQGITASDWVLIKEEEPLKAQECIARFSDVVYGSVMMKIEYLELRSAKQLYSYHCGKDKIILLGMELKEREGDFTDPAFIEKSMANPPQGLEVFRSEKEYTSLREDEIFQMLSNGCTTSDGSLFKVLSQLG